MRGLRRLQRAIELPFGHGARDRVRSQATHQSVVMQPGFQLPRRLLPELRDAARREAQSAAAAGQRLAAEFAGTEAGADRRRAQHSYRRRRRHRRSDSQRVARSRGASRRQARGAAGPDGARAEIWRRAVARADRDDRERLHGMRIPAGQVDVLARRGPGRSRRQRATGDAGGGPLGRHREHARGNAAELHPRARLPVSGREPAATAARREPSPTVWRRSTPLASRLRCSATASARTC